jgi:hypothetical protein
MGQNSQLKNLTLVFDQHLIWTRKDAKLYTEFRLMVQRKGAPWYDKGRVTNILHSSDLHVRHKCSGKQEYA